MKQVYTYFWKTLPVGNLILLAPILLAFSKSSQIGPSSSNHLKSLQADDCLGILARFLSLQCPRWRAVRGRSGAGSRRRGRGATRAREGRTAPGTCCTAPRCAASARRRAPRSAAGTGAPRCRVRHTHLFCFAHPTLIYLDRDSEPLSHIGSLHSFASCVNAVSIDLRRIANDCFVRWILSTQPERADSNPYFPDWVHIGFVTQMLWLPAVSMRHTMTPPKL